MATEANTFDVEEPWFTHIAKGDKVIEGRLGKGKFSDLTKGQKIKFVNKGRKACAVVTDIKTYKTFEEYLSHEGLSRTLPGVHTIADGVKIYRKYYSAEKEQERGIVAIHLKKTK